MKYTAQRLDLPRFLLAASLGALLGVGLGVAVAENPPGQLDTACASRCAIEGYDGESCGRVCWVPDPQRAAEAEELSWPCLSACRQQGGKLSDCVSSCRR